MTFRREKIKFSTLLSNMIIYIRSLAESTLNQEFCSGIQAKCFKKRMINNVMIVGQMILSMSMNV